MVALLIAAILEACRQKRTIPHVGPDIGGDSAVDAPDDAMQQRFRTALFKPMAVA